MHGLVCVPSHYRTIGILLGTSTSSATVQPLLMAGDAAKRQHALALRAHAKLSVVRDRILAVRSLFAAVEWHDVRGIRTAEFSVPQRAVIRPPERKNKPPIRAQHFYFRIGTVVPAISF